jgi:ketosteroid isomerase-like protein
MRIWAFRNKSVENHRSAGFNSEEATMRRFLMLALVPITLAACQAPAPELTDALKAEIAAEVDATAEAWWEAWADADYDRGMAHMLDAPEVAWTGDEGTLYSVAEMDAEWESAFTTEREKQDLNFTDSRTIVLAPDIAYTIRGYDVVVTETSGVVRPQVSGVETVVWVKRDGQWKVFLGHESTLEKSWQVILDQGGW